MKALAAVHNASARNWEDIGDMCQTLNLGPHLTMFWAVPSVFEPAMAGHHAATGQHRYWVVKCLKKAGVELDQRKKILQQISDYRSAQQPARATVQTCLQIVAKPPNADHEPRLESLNAAVEGMMTARKELLKTVYSELTATEKCKIAGCTVEQMK